MKGLNLFVGFLVALSLGFIMLTFVSLIGSSAQEEIGGIEGIDAFNSSQCQGSLACNSTSGVLSANSTAIDWLDIVVLMGIGVVLISFVLGLKLRKD